MPVGVGQEEKKYNNVQLVRLATCVIIIDVNVLFRKQKCKEQVYNKDII